jgi:hypothetical protein
MDDLQVKINQIEHELNAVKFILGIGGEENDFVPNFRRWDESELRGVYKELQGVYKELQGVYKELQAKENILLTQQLKAGAIYSDDIIT